MQLSRCQISVAYEVIKMKLFQSIIFFSMLMIGISYAQTFSYEHLGCSSDRAQLCTVTETCELSLTEFACTSARDRCRTCPPTTLTVDGVAVSCQNTCEEVLFGLTAGCTACVPNMQNVTIPTKILSFSVYNIAPVDAVAIPETRTGLAGDTLEYTIAVKNPNPFAVTFVPRVAPRPRFTFSLPSEFTVDANAENTFTASATSESETPQGQYSFRLVLDSASGSVDVDFKYVIAEISPPTMLIANPDQQGAPGSAVTYDITLRNNAFQELLFSMNAQLPGRWLAVFTPSTLDLQPAETKTTSLRLTSASDALGGSVERIVIVAENPKTSAEAFVSYRITACGDGVCNTETGESLATCQSDCPLTQFICNGECDVTTGSGVDFSAVVNNFAPAKFIVCERSATPAGCESDFTANRCGIDAECLCGSATTSSSVQCSMRCSDASGVYYMYAKNSAGDAITSAKFEFVCPDLGLGDIMELKDNFTAALEQYEMSRSAFLTTLQEATTNEQRARVQPCYDTLGTIIQIVTDYIAVLDNVIANPSISRVTSAKSQATTVRQQIGTIYDDYCRGETGYLAIETFTQPANTQPGGTATAYLNVQNVGSAAYYGYGKCTFAKPSGETVEARTNCVPVPSNSFRTFAPFLVVNEIGTWSVSCAMYGSLNADCSAANIHSSSQSALFSVAS